MSNLHIVLRPLFNLTTICSSLLIERIDRLRTTRAFSSTLYYHSVNSGKYLYMYSYIAFFSFFFLLSTTSLPLRPLYTSPSSVSLPPPPPPQTIPVETTQVILVEPTPKQPKVITNGVIPPQTLPHLTPPRPITPPPPVTTTLGGTMSPEKPSLDAS